MCAVWNPVWGWFLAEFQGVKLEGGHMPQTSYICRKNDVTAFQFDPPPGALPTTPYNPPKPDPLQDSGRLFCNTGSPLMGP